MTEHEAIARYGSGISAIFASTALSPSPCPPCPRVDLAFADWESFPFLPYS